MQKKKSRSKKKTEAPRDLYNLSGFIFNYLDRDIVVASYNKMEATFKSEGEMNCPRTFEQAGETIGKLNNLVLAMPNEPFQPRDFEEMHELSMHLPHLEPKRSTVKTYFMVSKEAAVVAQQIRPYLLERLLIPVDPVELEDGRIAVKRFVLAETLIPEKFAEIGA